MHKPTPPANFPELTDAQLLRLVYSQWDFQQALSALIFLLEECDFEERYSAIQLRRFRCYESSIIISFARPFEVSRGKTALGLKAIGIELSPSERQLRDRVMDLRRKVVAHSDEGAMHFKGVILQPFDDVGIKVPLFKFQETLHLAQDDVRPLETLLRKLTHAIAAILFQLAQVSPERLEVYKAPAS
ncbi:MAG: hypothetical protein Q7U84_00430 [Polynucleobacter sp.]|nr:hypothetical protein [Polynucleobacter sp.]